MFHNLENTLCFCKCCGGTLGCCWWIILSSPLLLSSDTPSPVLLEGEGCLADVTSDFKHHGLQLVAGALKLRFL